MSLGTYNNNKKSSSAELTVYSNLKFSNSQSEVDKTSLSFTLWNNMLGIQLAPIIVGADGSISYDRENSIVIWLSTFKALMLAREIDRFIAGEATNVGVHTRTGIINITDGHDRGIQNPCLTIRKLDENGQVISDYAYEIRTDYHYSIDNFEERRGSAPIFEKHYGYNGIELEMIKIQCEEYVKAMSMGQAYASGQVAARSFKRMDYKLNKIAEASGITFDNNGGGQYKNSYFDTADSNNLASNNDDFE